MENAIRRLKEAGDELFESIKKESENYGEVKDRIKGLCVICNWENRAEAEYLEKHMKKRFDEEVRGLPIQK